MTLNRSEDPMKMKSILFILWLILSLHLAGWRQPSFAQGLMATDEEVRQFFATYVDRYNRKEIDGFLSLFSPKVIQNQKQPFEEIKKAYTLFFNQSLTLQYQLDELRYEIYQNGVEAKARYTIHQKVLRGEKGREWTGRIRWVLTKEDGVLKIISLNFQHEKVP